jgi:hypothetical protein
VPASRFGDYFGLIEFGDHTQHFAAMAEKDPEPIEVLVRQFGKDANIDPILGKTPRVLPKPKLLEPVRNLLHWLHRLLVGGWPNSGPRRKNVIPIFLSRIACLD